MPDYCSRGTLEGSRAPRDELCAAKPRFARLDNLDPPMPELPDLVHVEAGLRSFESIIFAIPEAPMMRTRFLGVM